MAAGRGWAAQLATRLRHVSKPNFCCWTEKTAAGIPEAVSKAVAPVRLRSGMCVSV